MEANLQRLTINVLFFSEPDDPEIDWQNELAQAMNEANRHGTVWHIEAAPVEKIDLRTM